MKTNVQQSSLVILLSLCSAGMLLAEQRVTPGDAARLQAQFRMEQQDLQCAMELAERENRHVVTEPSVHALELRRAEATAEQAPLPATTTFNPRAPEEKAKLQPVLEEINSQLPEMNRSLKQASSNSTIKVRELKPLTFEAVLAAGDRDEGSGYARQLVQQRIQQEMTRADPEARRQLKALLAAMNEEKEIPLPANLPATQKSQLLPKGAP